MAGATLRLRVLTGRNAGAEIGLDEGEWVIGRGGDADFVFDEEALADAHLRLSVKNGRASAMALSGGVAMGGAPLSDDGKNVPLQTGIVLTIGGTAFTIGPEGCDWSAIRVPAAIPEPQPSPPPAAVPEVPTDEVKADAGPAPVSRKQRWWIPAALVLAIVLAGGSAGYFLSRPAPPPVPPPPTPMERLAADIARLGLTGKVTAENRAGRLFLDGLVATGADLRELQAAVRAAGFANASVTVVSEESLTESVRMMISGLGQAVEAALPKPNTVVLKGFTADDTKIEPVIDRLRRDIPRITEIDDQISTPQRARRFLIQEVNKTDLAGRVDIEAVGYTVRVSGTIDPEKTSWKDLREVFKQRFGSPLILAENFATSFDIAPRGVVTGSSSVLVTKDGQRLRVGDRLGTIGQIVGIGTDRVRVRRDAGEIEVRYSASPEWILEDRANVAKR